MPNPDGTLTIEEALGGGGEMPKTLSIEEALSGPGPMPGGPQPVQYAQFGNQRVEIDYSRGGLQSNERRLLANFGGPAEFQEKFLRSRGYQTGYGADSGDLLVLGPDGKAHPLQGPADWADPLNYAVDAATMWMGGGGGKLGTKLASKVGQRLLGRETSSVMLGMLPGQVLGVETARAGQQAIGQMYGAGQINPKQLAKEGALLYGGGATLYGGAQVLGRGGGIPKEKIAESVMRPGLTRRPAANAERVLSEQLAANVEKQAATETFGHGVYKNQFLGPLKDATLDVKSYADVIRSKITGGDHPSIRAADRALESLANRLEGRAIPNAPEITKIGQSRYSFPVSKFSQKPSKSAVMGRYMVDKPLPPTSSGRMKAGDVDAWISENLTDPLHGAYSRGSEAILANRLMEIRGGMAEKLYSSLGPGASSAQKLAQRSMKIREDVEKTFPAFGKGGTPVATGAERLRLVADPGPHGQTLRQILTSYDAEHGTTFLRQADDLATKQLWTAADRVKAQVIDNMLKPQYLRLGVIKQAARITGKQLVRATGQAIPLTGGAHGMIDNPVKRAEEEASEPSPEEMFPGQTNIGQER